MKTPFRNFELIALAIGLTGVIMNLFGLELGSIIMNAGFMALGISCLIDSIKNKYYVTASGKILLLILPLLIVAFAILGVFITLSSFPILFTTLLYSMQLRKERIQQLA